MHDFMESKIINTLRREWAQCRGISEFSWHHEGTPLYHHYTVSPLLLFSSQDGWRWYYPPGNVLGRCLIGLFILAGILFYYQQVLSFSCFSPFFLFFHCHEFQSCYIGGHCTMSHQIIGNGEPSQDIVMNLGSKGDPTLPTRMLGALSRLGQSMSNTKPTGKSNQQDGTRSKVEFRPQTKSRGVLLVAIKRAPIPVRHASRHTTWELQPRLNQHHVYTPPIITK
ncbi:hypothetical protein F5X96DRAFT_638571 [Biscogniauxia mediterranea]|nr:hypothetical protein F5X96DRAFT_638571 [Biscogniauxia mediterranea]